MTSRIIKLFFFKLAFGMNGIPICKATSHAIGSPWARQFTEDIWELSADPKWRPTLKQAHFIRQIHRERSERDIDVILIE